ncbi:MAG: MBL fold metallo-hydrolase [Betaproteobacteria bacterium]|nr:MBL fold metallo-hydrolase [Betaproteobacteria bacterium]
MAKWQFTKGLHDLGSGCYAWLQPSGTWGFSNSGLIADAGETLLVDTLYDLAHTQEMLDGYRAAVPAAKRIGTLVNTHANGDHYFGNQLVSGARIIASRACAEDMKDRPPSERAEQLRRWRELGDLGEFLHENLGPHFNFENTVLTLPTEVFDDRITLRVGAKEVRLQKVGPAHTRGDILAYVPADRIVFTGDILFAQSHPVIWDGPVSNWIRACDLMLGWDVETVVPGHGPITDKEGVGALKRYLEYLALEVRKRFDAGLSREEAVRQISLDAFRDWIDPERIIVNVDSLYREFSNDTSPRDLARLYSEMLRYRRAR